tara:strand:+ start:1343 stop:1648 length:306 start_codon:yes stop_codon:yes gene_type:complete
MSNIFDAYDDKIKPKKRRNINTITRVIKILKQGNKNTREIHAHLHETWPRWCPNMRQLCNVLAKNCEFIEVGKEKVRANDASGSYNLVIWGLADEAGLNSR